MKKSYLTDRQYKYLMAFVILANIIMVLVTGYILLQNPQNSSDVQSIQSQFVLASWDYPDEYGQGIDNLRFYENSTGSWVAAPFYIGGLPFYTFNYYNDDYTLNWSAGVAMKITVSSLFNQTLVGVSDTTEGQKYLRHNVTVFNAGQEVFSQQNFTFYDVIESENYYYTYEVVLDFTPVGGETYTVTVDHEIHYDLGDKAILTATSGSVEASSTTGDYTDTHDLDGVLFGGFEDTAITVVLWVTFSDTIDGFDFAAYWNASGIASIHIYNHTLSDWTLYDNSPNGDDSPLTWDNGTIENEDFYNSTHIGFRFYTYTYAHLYVDYFQIQRSYQGDWHDVTEAELYFVVPFDMGGFDTALIILGLIMIPASTVYLAHGVKHDRSSDRVFYALVAFMFGCGLLVAGVMP